jgi:glycosyltransferase involved in cell wall biosynthesis
MGRSALSTGLRLLSVVLPNFNHARQLPVAIQALLGQSRAPDEIIVVDDGSTDDSMEVLSAFAAEAPTIRVLENRRNLGVIPSLNRGLEAVRGRYVYFAAADDWVLPGFFASALRWLESVEDLRLFCGTSALVDGMSGQRLGLRPAAMPRYWAGPVSPTRAKRLLHVTDNWILTGASVFRHDAVTWSGAFDERLGSFADGFMARKIALEFGFFFDPQVVAAWAVYPESVSRRTASDPEAAAAALRSLPDCVAGDTAFPDWYSPLLARRWRFAVGRIAAAERPPNRAALAAVALGSPIDDLVLARICPSLPRRLAQVLGLAWLSCRTRSTAPRGLARVAISAGRQRLTTRVSSAARPF